METIYSLGLISVSRVAIYRLMIKSGFMKSQTSVGKRLTGEFFTIEQTEQTLQHKSEGLLTHKAFSWFDMTIPPKNGWHSNCMSGVAMQKTERHWSDIPDFQTEVGDIKTVWEASRFDWMPIAAAKAVDAASQDTIYIKQALNTVLSDWSKNNPINQGPNWKCGQETSLRVINLIITHLLISKGKKPTATFCLFLEQHLNRISKSLNYAIGQDNNHAVSEAVALFIAGAFLASQAEAKDQAKFKAYCRKGRNALEKSVKRLVLTDGMFSQYSAVYHRMLLALVSVAEAIRRENQLKVFSAEFYERMKAATIWMLNIIDQPTGDVPNFGANDGTFFLNLNAAPYRDFRPTTQFAASVFLEADFFPQSRLCKLFSSNAKHKPKLKSGLIEYPVGGLFLSRSSDLLVCLRLPIFKFRPSQSDGLHLDIWKDHQNIMMDTGTYSYADLEAVNQFSGTQSHNTVCFDGRDQMPRLSRFLFAKWLQGSGEINQNENTITGQYSDYRGCKHKRIVTIDQNEIMITDQVSGFDVQAQLSWHLAHYDWKLDKDTISCSQANIRFESESDFDLKLETTPRSLYYLQKDEVPVSRLTVNSACEIRTIITFMLGKNS